MKENHQLDGFCRVFPTHSLRGPKRDGVAFPTPQRLEPDTRESCTKKTKRSARHPLGSCCMPELWRSCARRPVQTLEMEPPNRMKSVNWPDVNRCRPHSGVAGSAGRMHIWLWVKNRYPKWLALASGKAWTKTCGPIPGD